MVVELLTPAAVSKPLADIVPDDTSKSPVLMTPPPVTSMPPAETITAAELLMPTAETVPKLTPKLPVAMVAPPFTDNPPADTVMPSAVTVTAAELVIPKVLIDAELVTPTALT